MPPLETTTEPPTLDLVFMGSADFAVPSLRALLAAGHRIRAVYAQPPKPAGRGRHERPCPVHAAALELGLPVKTPKTLRDEAAQKDFAALNPDAAVVAAYGLILPAAILKTPRLGCFNVHGSLLPRWRGAAPIQRAILAGDTETGVTIMQMDEGLDTGAMLSARSIAIGPATTAGALHDDLARIGARSIIEALANAAAGTLRARPQPAAGVTYAAKLSRDEGKLDWTKSADELARMVRAFDPWPGTWFEHAGERIKILAATATAGNGSPGTVLDDRATVACGTGALRLLKLQRPGRAAMDADAFLRGFALPAKTVLG